MATLKEQIDEMHRELRAKREAVWAYENEIYKLMESRIDCPHEWLPSTPNYEHEGRQCNLCGINDIYFETLKRSRKV